MHEIDGYAEDNALSLLSLEVREQNVAAIALYSECGWEKAGIRKNFYSSPRDNGVVMIKVFER